MNPAVYQWAIRHGVALQALQELALLFGLDGAHDMPPEAKGGTSEAAVQAQVRLEATEKGVKLWRNNVGALPDESGRLVRYGLANDSKELNKVIKSGDLIGWRSVLITPPMVGSRIAQFVSRECKEFGWRYTGKGREPAQLKWAELIIAAGGDAAFAAGRGTL